MKTDEQVPMRDTTFDGVVPQRLWIGVRNTGDEHKLEVVAEINGIEKVIWAMKPSYAERANGIISDFTNLSWVLKARANPPSIHELRSLVAWEIERKIVSEIVGGEDTESFKKYAAVFGPPQPAPDERKDLRKAIESLDGAAAVNLGEPSPGDLERLAKANRELLAEVKRLRAQAPTGPTREQVAALVEAARGALDICHTGSLMIHSCVSIHHDYVHEEYQKTERFQKQERLFAALAPFADKGGSNG